MDIPRKHFLIVLVLLALTVQHVQAATGNILFLSGSLSAGNHIWNRVIATSLADRGYNVTFLTPERDVSAVNERLHFLQMEGVYEKVALKFVVVRENHFQSRQPVFRRIKESHRVNNGISMEMLKSDGVKRLLNYPTTFLFDAIIHDTSAAQSLLGFWVHFNRPPLIAVSPSNIPVHLFSLAQIPMYPGVMLHPFADYSTNLVLSTRVYNLLYFVYDKIYRTIPFMATENRIARKLFGEQLMDLEAIEENIKLFLVNTHPVIDASLLLSPNVVPVGLIQLHRPGGIPKAIQMFLDASKNGVIVFSLGTGLFTPALNREEDDVFMEVFHQLYQYDILWKYDKTEKLECPRNVLMLDWLANQHLILQHPKVKLFITNGGPLSVQEAVYAGVPLIGIPMRFDQKQILVKIQRKGIAQLLPLRRLRNDTLLAMIRDVVDEQSIYQVNSSKMAQLLRSQPDFAAVSPVQRAVAWIDYVVEHSNSEHLQSPVANVPFRIIYSLDMILVVAFSVIGFWIIFFKHLVFDKMLAKARRETSEGTCNTNGTMNPGSGLVTITEQEIETENEIDANDGETDKKNS